MKCTFAFFAIILTTVSRVQADITWEQARQIVSTNTGIALTSLNCDGESSSLINERAVCYKVYLKSSDVRHEVWGVEKSTGAVWEYWTDNASASRYPLTSTWVWNQFPQFNPATMAEYPQGSDCWIYRSPQGVLCTERSLRITHTTDVSSPINGYEVTDLPLPQLSNQSVIPKTSAIGIALNAAQNMSSWAGDDYADFIYSCSIAASEPIYQKDTFGVEWVIYQVSCISSPLAGISPEWLQDNSRTNDIVRCNTEIDAYTGQIVTNKAFLPVSVNNPSKKTYTPPWKHIYVVYLNGNMSNMMVYPIFYKGRCYVHEKYAHALSNNRSIKWKTTIIGKAPYVGISELRTLLGIKASYNADLNRLDITTAKETEKPAAKTTPKPVK